MINFCTLFDHNYLSRGLALYQSLQEQCTDKFSLYILTLDDIAYEWLEKQQYKNVVVRSLSNIKEAYPVLIRLQEERTRAEFSWTLSSFSIQYFLKKYNLDSITYLDADIYFYANPQLLLDELKCESVIITPHNYTPKYDQSATSGRYCVQFMYFRNDEGGNRVLEWWRNACEECCCGKPTDGKFGDQKYLDDWLSRFPGIVHEEKHMGCGVAPWNIQQFDIIDEVENLWVQNKITKVKERLVFFHYHALREFWDKYDNKWWNLNGGYELENNDYQLYKYYIQKLDLINKNCPTQNKMYISFNKLKLKHFLRIIKYKLINFIKILSIKDTVKKQVFMNNDLTKTW